MTILEVPLCDLLEAPARHRIREAKPERIKALAEAFKDGSPLTNPLKAYRTNGKWHVVGGLTRLAALRLAFGADSPKPIPVSSIKPDMDRDARLEAAKDNNVEPMTTLEWQGLFAEWLPVDKTQDQVARRFGVTQQFVSKAMSFDPFAPIRPLYNSVVKPSEKDMSHLESAHGARESVVSVSPPTPPESQGPGGFSSPPETEEAGASKHPDAETSSSNGRGEAIPVGVLHAEATSPSLVPEASPAPLISPAMPIPEAKKALEALDAIEAYLRPRAYKNDDAALRKALAAKAGALSMRLADFSRDLAHGLFGDHSRPREYVNKEYERPMEIRVLINDKKLVVPLIAMTSSGAKVDLGGKKVKFVPMDRVLGNPQEARA